ncbi:MAG: SLATT domain-containing protein [Nocardia sp.]|nr:SLATT domain-containing protein [Nocardia sp.]
MTDERPAPQDRDPYLLAQVREAFGRVVYSHKTHEKQADICFSKHRWQQGVLIALTAISSGTFLAAVTGLLGSKGAASLVTSSVALLVSWMSLGAKTFKFEEESDAHRGIASRLWDVRESYISLIADLMSGTVSDDEGRERRDELQLATRDAYADAPRTSARAFARASEGLQRNEEMTFTSREIDLFLPEALRLDTGERESRS